MIKISPSILSADFSKLYEDVRKVEIAGAELLHIDVMDGHFVPNLTIGVPVIKSLRAVSNIAFDVHLMIDNPEKMLGSFIEAGAEIITFHYEAATDPLKLIRQIKEAGIKPSVSIKPATPAEVLFPLLDQVSMVLVMTVDPGFGAQKLIEPCLDKVRTLKDECLRRGLDLDIEVDGGINADNIGRVAQCGANVFVAGSAVYKAPDITAAIASLRENAAKNTNQLK